MIHGSKTLVIVGSMRPRRLGTQIAAWVAEEARAALPGTVEIVDLTEWPLPMDDEPGVPAVHAYESERTRAWSAKVAEAGAFVFVTPQYNWGYPAPLKNALDHLYKEWDGKPAMIVSYGGRGGGKCAAQLRQVLKGLHMRPVPVAVGLRITHARIKADSGSIDAATELKRHRGTLRRGLAQLARAIGGKRYWLWPW